MTSNQGWIHIPRFLLPLNLHQRVLSFALDQNARDKRTTRCGTCSTVTMRLFHPRVSTPNDAGFARLERLNRASRAMSQSRCGYLSCVVSKSSPMLTMNWSLGKHEVDMSLRKACAMDGPRLCEGCEAIERCLLIYSEHICGAQVCSPAQSMR